MTSVKRIFAAMAAGLAMVSAVPSRAALDIGQKRPLETTIEQLKKDKWEPVAMATVPLPPSPPAAEGTIEAEMKPTPPVLVIFNQKGTDSWSIGTKIGEEFIMHAEGQGLSLSPLQDESNLQMASLQDSGRAKIVPVQQVMGSPRCGPADKIDISLKQGVNLTPVVAGVEKDGKARMSFYAAYDNSGKWAVTRTTTDSVSCVVSLGTGYVLNPERKEFLPEWKRNLAKPS